MSVSKLFTPKLHARPCVTDAGESDAGFVNPPTHAEVPVFSGPTDAGRVTLTLGAGKGTRTPGATRHPVHTKRNADY